MGTHKHAHITGAQKAAALIGGAAGALLSIGVRIFTGSPHTVWHRLGCAEILPPLWFLSLLYVICFFCLGATVGVLLLGGRFRRAAPVEEAAFWRGCTCLCLSSMFCFSWYALLFGKCALLLSLACLFLSALMALLCVLSFRTFSGPSALSVGGYTVWLLFLIFWHVAVIFRA